MGTGQRPPGGSGDNSGHGLVVKSIIEKRNSVVAGRAESWREVCRDMVRDIPPQGHGFIPVGQMAGDAF